MKIITSICLAASLFVFTQCGSVRRTIGRIAGSAIKSKLAVKPNLFNNKHSSKNSFPIIPVPHLMRRRYRPINDTINDFEYTTDNIQGDGATTEETVTIQDNDKSTTVLGSTVSEPLDQYRLKIRGQVEELTESCKIHTKLTPEQAKIVTNMAVPKIEAERCFLECVYNGIGLAKGGAFYEQGARSLALQRFHSSPDDLAKANSMIEVCTKDVVVKDVNEKCAIGRLVRECFLENGAKINFFPKP